MLSKISQTYKDTYHIFLPYAELRFKFRCCYICLNRTQTNKKEDFERRRGSLRGMRKVKEKIMDWNIKPGNRMTGREAEYSQSGKASEEDSE